MPKKQSIAQAKYDAKNCRYYGLKLVHKTDQDIIDKLASVPSMQGYIKQLIRDDIAKSGIIPKHDNAALPVEEEKETATNYDYIENFAQAIEAVKQNKDR